MFKQPALLLSLTVTFSALAFEPNAECPHLTGNYDCVGSAGKSIRTQILNINQVTYRLEDQIVIKASLQGEETIREGKTYKMLTKATCQNNVLDIETEFADPADGRFMSFVQRSYQPTLDGHLDVLMTWNNAEKLESWLFRCTKIK